MDRSFILTGTRETVEEAKALHAGPLSVEFDKGSLRTIRHGGDEVLRAIGYIVRDRDWGTYDPEISNLVIDQSGDRFGVAYQGACMGPDGATLSFDVSIQGSSDGTLVFDVTAQSDGEFETNRCGFCVLHPISGLAGAPVIIEHVDGLRQETVLPDLIDPWQPFKGMRAITTPVRPGVVAECRMEGDTFEMEDQRNWSDASYKTYVRPLALPWPYVLKAGEKVRQTVSLRFHGTGEAEASGRATAPAAEQSSITLRLGDEGPALPAIGLVIYPDDVAASLAQVETLRALAPQRLLFHFDPLAGHDLKALKDFAALSSAYPVPATLEVVLPCRGAIGAELAGIAGDVAASGLRLDAIFVSPSIDRQSTPPGSVWPECPPLDDIYAAARRAFPGISLGGGMLSYFTELNRKRVPAGQLDFISHCTCPIVHAADDLSVMQSLQALPFITRSVRAIYGDMPYRIGPSTIAMRQNPYGGATKDNPALARIAMAKRDPRHNALFAAAWAVGYAAQVASAGLDQLVLGAFAGPFGLIAEANESVTAADHRPLYHVVRELSRLAGNRCRAVVTGQDDALACLFAQTGQGPILLMANLTAAPITVDCAELAAGAPPRVLDAAAIAAGAVDGFVERPQRNGRLELDPYAVARLAPRL